MSSNDTKKNTIGKPHVNSYRRTDVMTASRESILLMLYAGAIRFLRQGIEAAERGDTAEKARLLLRTQDIVTELRSTLNFEAGGEIAKNLDMLYGFISQRLVQANLAKATDGLKDALSVLETLNSAWEGAVASLRKSNP